MKKMTIEGWLFDLEEMGTALTLWVYTGDGQLLVQSVPVPLIGRGEMLVRVEACGICHTDLKKVAHDLLPPLLRAAFLAGMRHAGAEVTE